VTRTELAALVERWRRILLPEWRVLLMDGPPPDAEHDGFWAICETKPDYRELCVYFTPECLADRDRCEVTVVHELLHALTRPWRQQIDSIASDLAAPAYHALRRAREHEEEQLVDRLARVIVFLAGGTDGIAAYGTREFTGSIGDAT
jgi:hypothetical protein